MPRSFSSICAVSKSSSTASTKAVSPNAYDATAPCASVQKGHCLSFDTNAANSSRSASLHSDGFFITSWK